jgi:hypothetical protein
MLNKHQYKTFFALSLLCFPLIFIVICLQLSSKVGSIQNRLLRSFRVPITKTTTHLNMPSIAGFNLSYLNFSIEKFNGGIVMDKKEVMKILNASHSQHSKLPNVIHVSIKNRNLIRKLQL